VLRSRVVWEDVDTPVQVVDQAVTLPVRHVEGPADLAALLAEDRRQGLDVTRGPLTRVAIIRESATAVRVVWTFHHVLLDGWSVFQILHDVSTVHDALRDGTAVELPARRPFRDYVDWIGSVDRAAAEAHWRGALSDLTAPTPLPYDRAPTRAHGARSAHRCAVELP